MQVMFRIHRRQAGPVQGWAREAETLCILRVAYTLGIGTDWTPLTLYVKITSYPSPKSGVVVSVLDPKTIT